MIGMKNHIAMFCKRLGNVVALRGQVVVGRWWCE
jgi:hypothetical protein